MSIINNKKIAIVGGGPGGLTLARLLQVSGADVTVYERDADRNARAQGATLDLHEESGLKALQMAGLMDAFRDNYRPDADKLRIMDKHANIIYDDHTSGKTDRSRPEIDRGPLQNILLDSLQPGTVAWDSQFVSLTPQDGGWQLLFKNGSTAYADIVIAADGANSKIRPYITPIRPFYSGLMVVEGMVYDAATATLRIHDMVMGGKIFAMSDSKTLIISSKGDGSMVFYTGCNLPESWPRDSGIDFTDQAQVKAWFKAEFAGWDEVWDELYDHAKLPFTPRPQYRVPLDQTWDAMPNLTMLGDAAHVMPPSAGEGVNMAMQDALELSECLTGGAYPDVLSAIAAYEQQMRARAAAVSAETMEATKALHGPDAIDFMVSIIGGGE